MGKLVPGLMKRESRTRKKEEDKSQEMIIHDGFA